MSAGSALQLVQPTGELIAVDEWTDQRKEFIRKAYCGGADDETASAFLMICERRRLSPEAKHVYLINRGRKGGDPKWVIQTAIDGFRLIAARTERYVGSDDPVFVHDPDGRLAIATVTVRKLVSGHVGAFTASARWDEYSVATDMWQRMPHTMLAKCAESLALRKAFPEELSGMYTDVEMDQADAPVVAAKAPAPKADGAPRAAVTAGDAAEPVMDWTTFWNRLKARGIDGPTFESVVGKKAGTFSNPQLAIDALAQAEAAIVADQETQNADYTELPADVA